MSHFIIHPSLFDASAGDSACQIHTTAINYIFQKIERGEKLPVHELQYLGMIIIIDTTAKRGINPNAEWRQRFGDFRKSFDLSKLLSRNIISLLKSMGFRLDNAIELASWRCTNFSTKIASDAVKSKDLSEETSKIDLMDITQHSFNQFEGMQIIFD